MGEGGGLDHTQKNCVVIYEQPLTYVQLVVKSCMEYQLSISGQIYKVHKVEFPLNAKYAYKDECMTRTFF